MQQNTVWLCRRRAYGTVRYSHFHARRGPWDNRSLRVHSLGIMDFFSFGHLRWIRQASLVCLLAVLSGFLLPLTTRAESGANSSGRVSLDFNDVELSVFVRFISELTGKNFVLDEVVKKAGGKISVYSPTKVTHDQAYNMFVAALEVSRLAVISKGNVNQIVAMGDLPPERGVFVYKLKNANATDLAAILTNLVARSQTVAQTAPGTRPLFRPLSEFEAPVQVFADKATNSIIISSTKTAYTKLQSVIRDLDTRRNQVFVEAVILEVEVDRLRQIGSDPIQVIGAGKSGALQGIGGFNTAPENLATIAQSIIGGAATGGTVSALNTVNVRAFLQLLLSLTDTNVLSTPQVLAADNQKAKIVVGENRPFPTGQAQGITGGTLVTIERKDVGVTLEFTPQVMENDLIRLEIKQEITAIAEAVAQTIGSGTASIPVGPTTTKRSMETTAIAKDQQTIVVGGLVRDNITINERKVPLLGDIPFLGWLFKFESRQIVKLNLLVFLTPTLVRDEADMVELNARKAAELGTLQRETRIEEPTKLKQDVLEKLERQNGTPRPLPNTVDPSAPLQPPVQPE
jgi:general secretion pathway protein D